MLRSQRILGRGVAAVVAAGSVLVSAGVADAAPAPASQLPPVAAAVAPDEGAALSLAAETGDRIEVASARSEFSQLFAEPDGRLIFESTVEPERVRQADGTWLKTNLELFDDEAGAIRPRASVAEVRFSDGGSGPLATMVNEGTTFSITWTGGDLPKPSLMGDSATYTEVLPGVDLVVRATALGFSHVLAVKSAEAATNSELRAVRFEVGGDARVVRSPEGDLSAVAGDALVALADGPAMWDSRQAVSTTGASARGAPQSASASIDGTVSSPARPGDAARVASVATEVTAAGDLVLRPDAALLSDTATYPVFIDPGWSKGRSRWAYATNDNSNNTDTSQARVGRDPSSGKLYRSFFEFPTTTLKAKHIESAYVQMKLDHSWSCTKTHTHLYHSGALSATPRTKWATSLIKRISGADSNANEGMGCDDSPQPDMTVNFTGAGVTSLIQSIANNGTAAVTVGFSARNAEGDYETDQDRWKKWLPGNAKLIAEVDAKPGKPHTLQVNGVKCNTSSDIRIGVTNPYFSAIFPDGDKGQAIKGTWEWTEQQANGTWVAKTAPPQTSVPANDRTSTARVSGAVSGRRYGVRVKGTDPAPYNINSDWSATCTFVVDTTVPPVKVTPVELPAGPGKSGRFKITSPAGDVSSFRYGWTEAVISPATPLTETGVAGSYAIVTVAAPKYGINTLYAQAIDSTNNKGYGSAEFKVDRPSPPVARWGLETNPNVTQSAALADGQPTLAGDTPLTGSGASWTDKGRVVGAKNATLTGVGALSTQSGVVDTTKSFAVAAWARLDQVTDFQTLVSQDGTRSANFQLQFRPEDRNGDGAVDRSWCFTSRLSDTDAASFTAACALNTVTADRWTHVAGGYDAAAKKLRLWIDGVLKAEVDAPAAWAAAGPLRVGNRRHTATQWHDYLYGSVADVQIYDRMLVQHDFTGQLAADEDSGGVNEPGMLQPVEVGRWDFEAATNCPNEPAEAGTCEAPDGAAWGRRLRLTYGTAVDSAGHRGRGGVFSATHYTENPDSPNYGAAVRTYGRSQNNTAPAEGTPLWADGPVLRTDQSFTISVWVQIENATSTMTAVAQKGGKQSPFYLGTRNSTVDGVSGMRFEVMTASADAATGETYTHVIAPDVLTLDNTPDWTHLTFVYDAAAKVQRLYINGDIKTERPVAGSWNAGGPLLVGNSYYTNDAGVGGYTDQWHGGIDDLHAYQGALTGAQVAALHEEQAIPES